MAKRVRVPKKKNVPVPDVIPGTLSPEQACLIAEAARRVQGRGNAADLLHWHRVVKNRIQPLWQS